MPNRILKESICTSDTLTELSWFEEVVFYRLIVNCDDFGRFDARPAILKSRLFPLKDTISPKDVEQAVGRLEKAGLVILYTYGGKPYLQLSTWANHQQIRAAKSKYPSPDESTENLSVINCCPLPAKDNKCSRNPIQSQSYTESQSYAEEKLPQKQIYGEFKKVQLTEKEFTALGEKLGEANRTQMIDRLDGYIASSGKQYKSHYATILTWYRKDVQTACPASQKQNAQTDDTLLELERLIANGGNQLKNKEKLTPP